jgi:conjugal transfer pilus assembly protein TraB
MSDADSTKTTTGSAGVQRSASVRKKQYLFLGLAGVAIAAVSMGGALFFSAPEKPRNAGARVDTKPKQVNVTVPGQALNDKDAWRAQESARISEQTTRVTDLDRQLAQMKAQLDKLGGTAGTPGTPNASGTKGTAGATAPSATVPPNADPRANAPPPPNTPGRFAPGLLSQPLGQQAGVSTPGVSQVGRYPPGQPGNLLKPGSAPMQDSGQDNSDTGRPSSRIVRIGTPVSDRSDGASSTSNPNSTTNAGQVTDTETGKAGSASVRTAENYLPSGSFFEGKILSGLDAPTGGQSQNNPVPFLIEVTSDAFLPSHMRSDVKQCFIMANGYGDISAERAIARTESMSCIKEDGTAIDIAIKGYIAGEDGKAGIRGRLVSKQGQILANALTAGVLQGLGSALSLASTTSTTNPLGGVTTTADPGKGAQAGFGTGFSKSMDKLAQYYITLSDKVFPVIEVDAERKVTIILTKGTFIDNRNDARGGAVAAATNAVTGLLSNTKQMIAPAFSRSAPSAAGAPSNKAP